MLEGPQTRAATRLAIPTGRVSFCPSERVLWLKGPTSASCARALEHHHNLLPRAKRLAPKRILPVALSTVRRSRQLLVLSHPEVVGQDCVGLGRAQGSGSDRGGDGRDVQLRRLRSQGHRGESEEAGDQHDSRGCIVKLARERVAVEAIGGDGGPIGTSTIGPGAYMYTS